MLVAAILAPGGRMLLGDRGPAVQAGMAGLNPCLIALSLPTFFEVSPADPWMWAVLVGAVASTVLLTRLCVSFLPLPTLVVPFLLTFWALLALEPSVAILRAAPPAAAVPTVAQPGTAVLSSLGEVVFSPNPWSGMLFLAGALLSNWRHGLIALVGGIVATAVAFYHGDVAHSSQFDAGLFGFNGVLTSVAVFVICGGRLRLAILGAVLATILTPLISSFGLVALSAPFVLTTWLVIVLGWIEESPLILPPTSEQAPVASRPEATSSPAG